MLAGTLVALMVSGGALVLLFAERRSEKASVARLPLQTVASTIAMQFFVIGVMLLFGQVLWAWWPSDAIGRTTWFQPLFFGLRFVAYYLALVLTVVSFKSKTGFAERFLFAPLLLVVASYDLVVGIHPPAPFWLGTLVWVPLISFGIATAASLALLIVRLLERTGAVRDDPSAAVGWLQRCAFVAALVAIVGIAGVVTVVATSDVAAAWRTHGDGVWRVWSIACVVLLALGCAMVGSANRARQTLGAIFVLLSFAIVACVAILPATLHSSTGIGISAVGGLAAGLAAPAFGLIAALNKVPYPQA